MNVLSLFDGISCGQIALERAGIKVDNYFASEIDKYAIKVAQKNYPNTIQLGDITKVHYRNGYLIWDDGRKDEYVGNIDLLMGGSPCFGGKSLVLTNKGYIPIENIKIGDRVMTHRGRFKKVLKTGNQWAKVVNVKAQGSTDIIATPNHPFYTIRKIKNGTIILEIMM